MNMKTFEILTSATCISTVKANSKEEALRKLWKMTEEQRQRRTKFVNVNCDYPSEEILDEIDEFVTEI